MNVLILDDYQEGIRELPSFGRLSAHAVTVFTQPVASMPEANAVLAETEVLVLIRERSSIDEKMLRRMPKLRHIAQTGKVGKHVDLEACRQRGVSISEGSGTAYAAAELAFLLMMSALRRQPQEIAGMKAGRFGTRLGRTLKGRRLGIIGYGKAGTLLARFASAFEMDIVVHGSEASMQRAVNAGYGAQPDRAAFFASCDVISVQLRLTPETRGHVTEADLMAMKPDAVLVNTARAELVEQAGLANALSRGRPGQYVADVFVAEPPSLQSDPVLALEQVTATPHIGYLDIDSFDLMLGSAIDNLLAFAQGEPRNLVA